MKLLIILSVDEYTNDVREILARQKVAIYSETEIHGFRTEAYQPDISNWFAHEDHGVYSTLFFSFMTEDSVERVLEEVKKYNEEKGEDQSNPLHAYQIEVQEAV